MNALSCLSASIANLEFLICMETISNATSWLQTFPINFAMNIYKSEKLKIKSQLCPHCGFQLLKPNKNILLNMQSILMFDK